MKNSTIWMCRFWLVVTGLCALSCKVTNQDKEVDKPLNILFIAIDDLRPELGSYGKDFMHTPRIDELASEGILFERAYCQQAVCSPSRTSLLTGLRPDATGVHDLTTHFRNIIPEVVTLPQHFKNNGFHTEWWGKIYHAMLLDSLSWSIPGRQFEHPGNWRSYVLDESKRIAEERSGRGPAFENADVPDNAYPDGKVAEGAVASLRKLAAAKKPFFLAVGFLKPHLPFNAPKKYWDLYDPATIDPPPGQSLPENAPSLAGHNSGELRSYYGIPENGPLTDAQAVNLIHGYRASVSYTDAQVGKLLDELKRTGLDKNTIVILWGDHGWKLGDYGMWAKHTNFEVDTRAPLILRSPTMTKPGIRTDALVEFVDIYPSLCELAGLPVPSGLAGKSFVPLMENPELEWKEAAFSQYPRPGGIMGYSMRTDRYRFTRWQKRGQPREVVAYELYDLEKDPDGQVNIADLPESKKILEQLSQRMLESKIGDQPVP